MPEVKAKTAAVKNEGPSTPGDEGDQTWGEMRVRP